MHPVKLLPLSMGDTTEESKANSSGMGPVSRLLDKSRVATTSRLPISGGMRPVSRLPWRFSTARLVSWPISAGMLPLSWFPSVNVEVCG